MSMSRANERLELASEEGYWERAYWRLIPILVDMLGKAIDAKDIAVLQRDAAVAHDRQPYPTAWAYEKVCKARDRYKEKLDLAEERLHKSREALIATGYFSAAEVGPDVAPRIYELWMSTQRQAKEFEEGQKP